MKRTIIAAAAGLALVSFGLAQPATAATPKPSPAVSLLTAQHKIPPRYVAGAHHASPQTVCGNPNGCFSYSAAQANPSPAVAGIAEAMDVETPGLDGDSHSLAELAVQSADQKQVVEVGWTVDHALNGDYAPHLFVFSWVNGVPKGYNNTTGSGFTQCTAAGCGAGFKTAGQSLAADSGTLKAFSIQNTGTAWWIAYGGQWVGYYDEANWTGASPAVTFTSVPFFETFGEVASFNTVQCAKMGDGTKGSNQTGTPAPARIGSVTYVGSSALPTLSLFNTVPTSYDNAFLPGGTVRSFSYGGDNTAC